MLLIANKHRPNTRLPARLNTLQYLHFSFSCCAQHFAVCIESIYCINRISMKMQFASNNDWSAAWFEIIWLVFFTFSVVAFLVTVSNSYAQHFIQNWSHFDRMLAIFATNCCHSFKETNWLTTIEIQWWNEWRWLWKLLQLCSSIVQNVNKSMYCLVKTIFKYKSNEIACRDKLSVMLIVVSRLFFFFIPSISQKCLIVRHRKFESSHRFFCGRRFFVKFITLRKRIQSDSVNFPNWTLSMAENLKQKYHQFQFDHFPFHHVVRCGYPMTLYCLWSVC